MNIKNVTVKKAMETLMEQNGYSFVYEIRDVDTRKIISVEANNKPIDEVIKQVLQGQDLSYQIRDKTIIVKKEVSSATIIPVQKKITGVIVDEENEPIIGANVIEKGTLNGTVTGLDGEFSLDIKENSILQITYIGFITKEVTVGSQSFLRIQLIEDIHTFEEVVIIGYGTQKKENLTGSVVSVKSGVFENRPTASPATSLQGVAAGLTVLQNSNYPGAGASIKVREVSTWQKDVTPLYVIDGVQKTERDFGLLNPSDIDNISILKDAASAAIYGIKGGNGVILVTTKNGVVGKPRISYSYTYTHRKPTMFPEYMNAYDLSVALNETYRVKGLTPDDPAWYTPDEQEYFKTHSYQNDWKDAVWLKNPVDQTHNISVSGGSDSYRYYVSGSYLKQDGATNNNYEKFTFLAKMEGKIMTGLDFSLNMSASWDNSQRPYWAYGNEDNLRGLIARAMGSAPPFRPVFINDMPVGNLDNTNMGALARGEGGYVKKDNNTFSPTFELKYRVPKVEGLLVRVRGSYNMQNNYNKTLGLSPWVYFFKTAGEHNHIITDELDYRQRDAAQTGGLGSSQRLITRYGRSHFYQLNGMVEYNNSFGLHNISAVGGYEQLRSSGDFMETTVDGFPNMNYTEVDGSLGKTDETKRWVAGSREKLWSQASFISRVDYNYDQRYLIGVTFRADGSYKFPPGNRWGYFPSISAGWNISRENFFEPLRKQLAMLKLRASWGITGSDLTDAWQWQQSYTYDSSSKMVFGGVISPKVELGKTVNPNITWEKNRNIGVGLDVAMPDNLVFLTVDYWHKKTTDILGTRLASVPEEVGASLPAINYGVVTAEGFEFSIGHENKIGEIMYRVGGNFAVSSNKIKEMDQASAVRDHENKIGKPVSGDLKGYICEGIIRTQADVDRILQKHGPDFTIFGVAPQPGMLMYKDLRGPIGVDEPDGKIDENDEGFISWNSIPRISYGFYVGLDWKNFDLTANFAGFARYEGFARGNWFLPNGFYNNQTYWKDQWTPENPNAKLPSGAWQGDIMGVNNVNRNSTFWLQNRSFMRLKSLVLGYNLNTTRFYPVKSLRIFLSGENLFEIVAGDWKKYSDPELGDGGAYPILRSFSAGFNITF